MRAAPPASHRPLQRGRKVQSTTGRAWRGAECSRQRSRGSGSRLGTRAAQFSEVPGALRMPSCKSSPGHCPALPADLRSANPASFLHLEVARMQEADARGAVWAFVPPPPALCPSKPNHPACWKPRSPASLPDKLGTGYREGTGPGESGLLSHQKHVNC